jgi:hypothetical protein
MAYTLTETFRTKAEAIAAVKAGASLSLVREGMELARANGGPFPIRGKLDQYKEWRGEAFVSDGRIYRIK